MKSEAMRDRESKKGGFSLLEVMISLAIIGGLLITVLYTLQYHLSIAERHEFATLAYLLAQRKMVEAEQAPASAKGDFPSPYTGFSYITEVRESPYPGVSEISVTVVRGDESVKLSELAWNE